MPRIEPRAALNKAFLKQKPLASEVASFRESVTDYLGRIQASFRESEEYHKNLSKEHFLQPVLAGRYDINTRGRADLVIRAGKTADTPVKVLLEYKSPSNAAEMPTAAKLDCKATRELLLYYLRERVTASNLQLTQLIVSNGLEWYIWDAQDWEHAFRDDAQLLRDFKAFEAGTLSGTSTQSFYRDIASPLLSQKLASLDVVFVDLRKLPQLTDGADGRVPPKLVAAFKLFSDTHLLKLPFANDSNSLNKEFYRELLYLMGLEEREVDKKNIIGRASPGRRHAASLLEATIDAIQQNDGLARVANRTSFGASPEKQLEEVALALVITWINRTLFCKLLEGQLLGYHGGDQQYAFMSTQQLKSYDDVAALWFKALAKQHSGRSAETIADFPAVPYLNSSLFEATELEKQATQIGVLSDGRTLPYYASTVFRTQTGRRRSGETPTLRYLLEFLDAYDFRSEATEGETLDQPKGLINASVLGLIFEKINGYKEGSFYTPGFVTEYMCEQTIRAAIISRFRENPTFPFDSDSFADLVNFCQGLYRAEDLARASAIVDRTTVCDPAVGSGHFLVSALNELLAAKSALGLLLDAEGRRLSSVRVEVVNDGLDVTLVDSDLFHEYAPGVKASDRIQQTLFEQKRRLIENCLFGVDINPNSVKICRLRLWVELLKHAYYRADGHLETLPNIDINIKTGNSLVSRFGLDVDITEALATSDYSLEQYRAAVLDYQEARTGQDKQELRELLGTIKNAFSEEITRSDPRRKKLAEVRGRLFNVDSSLKVGDLFGQAKTKELRAESAKLAKKVAELSKAFNDAEEGEFYKRERAFEWRLEFPGVLDDGGAFVGFDVVVGNPPYIRQEEFAAIKPYLKQNFKVFRGTSDLLTYFVELGLSLTRGGGQFSYIISNKFMRAGYGKELREYLIDYDIQELIDFGDLQVFDEATTYPMILVVKRQAPSSDYKAANVRELKPLAFRQNLSEIRFTGNTGSLASDAWSLTDGDTYARLQKLRSKGVPLGKFVAGKIHYGIKTGYNKAFVVDAATAQRLIDEHPSSEELIKPFLAGRDIKRYTQPVADKYVLFTRRGIDIGAYPAIHAHLSSFREALEPRPEDWVGSSKDWPGRKRGTYKWYEIQDSVDYWQEFEKPKIVYQEIATYSQFTLEVEQIYLNNKIFMLPEQPNWLLAILNTSIIWEYIKFKGTSYNGGAIGMQSPMISSIPIVEPDAATKELLNLLVVQRMGLDAAIGAARVPELEREIEKVVVGVYF